MFRNISGVSRGHEAYALSPFPRIARIMPHDTMYGIRTRRQGKRPRGPRVKKLPRTMSRPSEPVPGQEQQAVRRPILGLRSPSRSAAGG